MKYTVSVAIDGRIDVNVEAIQPNEEALIKKWTGINEKIKDKYVEILSK